MKIENNEITFIEEKDYDNLFIPENALGIAEEEYAIGFAAITPETITVEEGNTAFYVQNNCLIERATKTLIIAGGNAIIPDDGSVEIIADFAFNGNRTLSREFIIPDGVKKIGVMAFKDTNVEKFIIPASVEEIADVAFLSCDKTLEEIIVDEKNSEFYIELNCLINRNSHSVISLVNRSVKEVVIPKGIQTISYGTFYLINFDKVYIPQTVTYLLPHNFGITDKNGMSCDLSKEFANFCREHNIVYAYDKNG